VQRLGAQDWNRLHSLVYASAALALFHYLLSPGTFPDQFLMSGMFFWLMCWRVLQRRRRGTDAVALAILALVSSVFTALLEVAWGWLYHGDKPLWVLGNNLRLVLGIPPAWTVLALGLLIALAAAICARRPRLERARG